MNEKTMRRAAKAAIDRGDATPARFYTDGTNAVFHRPFDSQNQMERAALQLGFKVCTPAEGVSAAELAKLLNAGSHNADVLSDQGHQALRLRAIQKEIAKVFQVGTAYSQADLERLLNLVYDLATGAADLGD